MFNLDAIIAEVDIMFLGKEYRLKKFSSAQVWAYRNIIKNKGSETDIITQEMFRMLTNAFNNDEITVESLMLNMTEIQSLILFRYLTDSNAMNEDEIKNAMMTALGMK